LKRVAFNHLAEMPFTEHNEVDVVSPVQEVRIGQNPIPA
jgi:hypothetical protein